MNHFTLRNIIQSALHTVVINAIYQAVKAADVSTYRQSKFEHNEYKKKPIRTRVDVPLNQVKDDTQVQYVSAIAHKLAASWNISALEAASILCCILTSPERQLLSNPDVDLQNHRDALHPRVALSEKLWPYLNIQQSSPGWLQIDVPETGLAIWLAYLFETLNSVVEPEVRTVNAGKARFPSSHSTFRNSTELFTIHHAIARCESLLHLATMIEPAKQRYSASPQSSSTRRHNLDASDNGEASTTYAMAQALPMEHRLIRALVNTFDEVSILSMSSIDEQSRYLKLIHGLSMAVHKFHAQLCVGSPKFQADPGRMQFRVQMLRLSSAVLRSLLTEGLGITPCVQL